MFEHLADGKGWLESTRCLMLQYVLPGKAQDVYLSLSARDCLRYSMVKSAVFKACELVPEAYS